MSRGYTLLLRSFGGLLAGWIVGTLALTLLEILPSLADRYFRGYPMLPYSIPATLARIAFAGETVGFALVAGIGAVLLDEVIVALRPRTSRGASVAIRAGWVFLVFAYYQRGFLFGADAPAIAASAVALAISGAMSLALATVVLGLAEFGKTRVGQSPRMGARRDGFTLVEALVVLAILLALFAILLPVLSQAKSSGRIAQCTSNLRQLGQAIELYRAESNGEYPPGLSDLVAVQPTIASVLTCPADRFGGANQQETKRLGVRASVFYWRQFPYGYREALKGTDPNSGIGYCVLHGRWVAVRASDFAPVRDTRGLVLRLRRDGSVQRAQVGVSCGRISQGATLVMRTEWSLLTDASCPDARFCDAAPELCRDQS